MKSVLLIGLGRFGRHTAMKLSDLNCETMAVDLDEECVNGVLPFVTNAQIGDSTNEEFLYSLGISNYDVCIVAIGDNFQTSLETASLLKDFGAKKVIARASTGVQEKFLLRNGADEVVYPEKEMAIRSAVKYSSDNVFDYIELTGDYSIYETPIPNAWIGKTIVDLGVRTRYHINIMALRRGSELLPLPRPDHIFRGDETMLILGANKDLTKFMQRR